MPQKEILERIKQTVGEDIYETLRNQIKDRIKKHMPLYRDSDYCIKHQYDNGGLWAEGSCEGCECLKEKSCDALDISTIQLFSFIDEHKIPESKIYSGEIVRFYEPAIERIIEGAKRKAAEENADTLEKFKKLTMLE